MAWTGPNAGALSKLHKSQHRTLEPLLGDPNLPGAAVWQIAEAPFFRIVGLAAMHPRLEGERARDLLSRWSHRSRSNAQEHVLSSLCDNPGLLPEDYREIARVARRAQFPHGLARLAANPNVPVQLLRELLSVEVPLDALSLLGAPRLDARTIRRIIRTHPQSEEILGAAALHPNVTGEILLHIAHIRPANRRGLITREPAPTRPDSHIDLTRRALSCRAPEARTFAETPGLPPEALEILLHRFPHQFDVDTVHCSQFLRSPNAPQQLLDTAWARIRAIPTECRWALASSPRTTPDQQLRLAADRSVTVRRGLASNPNITRECAFVLADDARGTRNPITDELALNPACPADLLDLLFTHGPSEVTRAGAAIASVLRGLKTLTNPPPPRGLA